MSSPEIIVYGRETCKLCKAAVEKLVLLGVPFEKEEIDKYFAPHDGWRSDGSIDINAAYHAQDGHLPVIKYKKDFLTYPDAMRIIKQDKEAGQWKSEAGGAPVAASAPKK